MIIALASGLALSYVIVICFTYYVCCRARRRKKRRLTAVQQRALSRRTVSQNNLENLALEGDDNRSTPVSRENQVFRHNGEHSTPSQGVRGERAPINQSAFQREEEHPVYHRLESCLFDPPPQSYQEVLRSLGHSSPSTSEQSVLQAGEKSPKPSRYQSLSPQLQAPVKRNSGKPDVPGGNLYQKLLLKNEVQEKSQTSSSSGKNNAKENGHNVSRTSAHDYVEIISEETIARAVDWPDYVEA